MRSRCRAASEGRLADAMFGLANGLLVGGLGLPSIVVTLAGMALVREGLSWARHGAAVGDLPDDFQWFGLGQETGRWFIVGVAVVVFLAFAWALRFLSAGRAVYATGSDPDAAWLVGIRPRRVVVGVFVLMGALTGLAAVLNVVRFRLVYPDAGTGMEIQVIAAVVVGGVAIVGGRGNLFGPLLGVLLFGTIGSALIFLGSQINQEAGGTNLHHWEKAIQGGIILIVVAFEGLRLRRRKDATAYFATS
jgi:rhamnose transport system permease protein